MKDQQEAQVKLKLTEEFFCPVALPLCSVDVSVFIPDKAEKCVLSSVAQTGTRTPCGIRFYNEDVGKEKVLKLTNIAGDRNANLGRQFTVFLKTGNNLFDPMFSLNTLPPLKVRLINA